MCYNNIVVTRGIRREVINHENKIIVCFDSNAGDTFEFCVFCYLSHSILGAYSKHMASCRVNDSYEYRPMAYKPLHNGLGAKNFL